VLSAVYWYHRHPDSFYPKPVAFAVDPKVLALVSSSFPGNDLVGCSVYHHHGVSIQNEWVAAATTRWIRSVDLWYSWLGISARPVDSPSLLLAKVSMAPNPHPVVWSQSISSVPVQEIATPTPLDFGVYGEPRSCPHHWAEDLVNSSPTPPVFGPTQQLYALAGPFP